MGLLAAMEGELWQRQGFESYGDWRRASERARKAAKKAAAATKATAAALATNALAPEVAPVAAEQPPCDVEQDSPKVVRVKWQPLEQLDPPSPNIVNSPWSSCCEKVPGKLHEHVNVTPHGSRSHTMKHTSPGGTTRCAEYVSPAGARQSLEERHAWKQYVTRARHEERAARDQSVVDERDGSTIMEESEEGQFETWACPLFDGEELELKLGTGRSGYFGVHRINETTFKACLHPRTEPFTRREVWTSADPRECAAVLAKGKYTLNARNY